MSHKAWTRWTHEAVEQNPNLPDVAPDDPHYTTLYAWSTEPVNWSPRGAIDRITASDDPQAEYAEVVWETIDKARTWDEAPDELPAWYGTDVHVAGEMYALASRLVKGATNELAARSWLETNGRDVLSTNAALASTEHESVTELENAEIDFVTADGETWQVKSSEGEARKVENESVNVLIVNDGEVRAF